MAQASQYSNAVVDGIVATVRQVIEEVRPPLVAAAFSGMHEERTNLRHSGNFLSTFDLWLHDRYRSLLSGFLPPFIFASEEGEPEVVGDTSCGADEPDLLVLVDPLDTSELAVRGLHGYTQVLVYSRQLRQPLAAVVGDLFHYVQLYVAARVDTHSDVAWAVTGDNRRHNLSVHGAKPLNEALVTNYLMRPAERFVPLARQRELIAALAGPAKDGNERGRLGVDFGSVGLCHVAAGFTDAMVEFAKGFAAWDLYPGHYILIAAGGTVLDLQGDPLTFDPLARSVDGLRSLMSTRRRFVAAGDAAMARRLVSTIVPP